MRVEHLESTSKNVVRPAQDSAGGEFFGNAPPIAANSSRPGIDVAWPRAVVVEHAVAALTRHLGRHRHRACLVASRDAGRDRVRPLSNRRLALFLNESAEFHSTRVGRDGRPRRDPAIAPPWLVPTLVAITIRGEVQS